MRRVTTPDGIRLAVRDEGEGMPVVLLHGFPDSSHLWRHQIPALRGAGFQVVAPDLRGFGESDRPATVDAYRIANSVDDVLAILDELGLERAHVVGHDWGAGVAWALASVMPDRVERLVALSVGHPSAQQRTIEAREKAWYTLWFQFEGVAEEILPRDDWKVLREWTRGNGDVERYVEDLGRPGALTAALGWYRANLRPRRELLPRRDFPAITAPTMGIWSSGDDYLLEEPMTGSGAYVAGRWRYERVEGASHWMQVDEPERVSELLLDFLT